MILELKPYSFKREIYLQLLGIQKLMTCWPILDKINFLLNVETYHLNNKDFQDTQLGLKDPKYFVSMIVI